MLTRRALLTSAGAALAVRPARAWHGGQPAPAVDGGRLRRRIEQLSAFGRPAGGTFASGVSRVAYSDADVAGRLWLLDEVRAAGFTPRLDPAGNVFVRIGAGNRPPILFGSHIDSVPGGGNFDGDLGTLSALEVLQAVQATGHATRHPLEMVLWAHEESTAFGSGTACSRIVAGDLKAGDLDREWNGLRRADALRRIGGDPARIEDGGATARRLARLRRAAHRTGRHARRDPGADRHRRRHRRHPPLRRRRRGDGQPCRHHADGRPSRRAGRGVAARAGGPADCRRASGTAGRDRWPPRRRAELAQRRSRPGDSQRRIP